MRALALVWLLLTPLAALGADDPVDVAIKNLESKSSVTRVGACRTLGASRQRRAVPLLLTVLADEAVPVRVAAVDGLAELGDEVAVPRLVPMLRDPHPTVRGRALIAIGRLGGPYISGRVAPSLADPNHGVRICAVKALGALGDPLRADLVRALLDRTTGDPDHILLATAIVSLTQMEGRRALDDLFVRAGVDRAFGSWLVRASLIWAVGMCADRTRLPFVRRGFDEKDDRLAGAAATALLRLGETEPVLAAVADPDATRRRLAVAALAETGDPKWKKALLGRAEDPSARVRLEVAVGLSMMGAPEAFPILVDGLRARSTMIWGGCAQELVRAYGVDHGRNPEAWVAWYRKVRGELAWNAREKVWQ